jgi:imidazolonepropionase-like amidohydrolase/predicted esterase
MRAGALTLAAALLLPLAACAAASAYEPGAASLVLRGVTVIDGTGAAPRANLDVVIVGEQIAAIHPSGARRYARDARVLELPGRYVMPGLIDTHAHVTILRFHTQDDGTTRSEYRRDLSERTLRQLLAHGVTTVRNPSAPAEAGAALRDDVARGRTVGPRILTSGEHLNDSRLTEEELRAEVRRQAAAGVDMIKVYSGLHPAQVAAVIGEAHGLGLPVVGHLHRTTWTEAARFGIDAITHGSPWSPAYLPPERRAEYGEIRDFMHARLFWLETVDLDGPEIAEMIRELADRRIPVDPTLITYHTKFFGDDPRWTEHPELALVPELAEEWGAGGTWVSHWTPADFTRARALWPRVEALIRRFHEGGVLLSVGSDLPQPWTIPGLSVHQEMELLMQAGIPPGEVLRQATRNGAEALGLLDTIGTVEVGKRADLLVLSADPTVDIRHTRSIEAVIQGGVLLRPAELLGSAGDEPGQDARPQSGSLERPGLQPLRVAVHLPARVDTASLLLYLPRDLEGDGLLPAVLHLHGGSQRGSDLEKLKSYGAPRLLAAGHELPFILIAPQIPEGQIWNDTEGLIALLDELGRRYPIDPDRLYVTGTSMGGRGAWYLAYRHPDRFAAIAPVAAYRPLPSWVAGGRLGRLPVRAYHGDQDTLAPFAEAVGMHEALGAAGGASELQVLQGRDHFIAEVLEDPALYEWLLRQRRGLSAPASESGAPVFPWTRSAAPRRRSLPARSGSGPFPRRRCRRRCGGSPPGCGSHPPAR